MAKTRLVFWGTPDFAVPFLQMLATVPEVELLAVVTQPDRPQGRKMRLTPPPVKVAAEALGLPVLQFEDSRTPEAYAALAALAADLYLVVAYGQLLNRAVLALPRLGAFNIHPSALPEFRGSCPVESAILAGRETTEVCLMRLVRKMDAGPILARWPHALELNLGAAENRRRLADYGAEQLRTFLPQLLSGQATEEAQDEQRATYCQKLCRESGGLDWARPAAELFCQIQACRDWPATYCLYHDERLKIYNARLVARDGRLAAPGEILQAGKQLIVACGAGSLELLEVQKAGGKRLAPRDLQGFFVSGERLQTAPECQTTVEAQSALGQPTSSGAKD